MRKYIKFILLFLFAAFIFWFFGRNLDWKEVSQSLRQANPFYLAAATLIICLGYLLRAKRWQVLLEPITPSSLRELFATTTVGFTAVFLIGRMGEIVRPMWLPMRDKRVRPSAALVTLGVERIFDLASIICFFAINLIFYKAPAGREAEFAYIKFIGNMMLVGIVCGFLALIIFQRKSEPIIKFFDKLTDKKFIPVKLREIFMSLLKQLAAALGVLRDWREVVSICFWTLTLWLAIALPTWFVLLAFDLPLTFTDSLFIMGFAAFSSVIPTPGGAAGAFHSATAKSLIFLNVVDEKAWAASIAMHLVYFAPAIFFGLYYFLRGDISVSSFRHLLTSENAVEEIESESPNYDEEASEHISIPKEKRTKTDFQIANRKSEIENL
ncbi:MAG TPA: lysylphosphatidylglycerol synthase transmembrane domain-containing protein [Pyrinomonadaceae bacterium]|nr:lysylphosphatidylglycerol synthase transmembrane domain-containing protein [Pyrinomonadaceae bacterium]